MIFDERFDESLWLMMAGDKENRNKLVHLINIIPQHIYDYLHQKIIANRELSSKGHSKGKFFETKVFKMSDDNRCVFQSGILCGQLFIRMFIFNSNATLKESYELYLNEFEKDYIDGILKYGDLEIGHFHYQIEENTSVQVSNNYTIMRINSSVVLILNHNNRLGRLVNIKRMPNFIELTDFSTYDKINQLIKSKKKNNVITSILNK